VPAEPAETAKTVSVQSTLKKPDHEDLPAEDDEDVQKGYGEYLEHIEETDLKLKEGTQAYWDWLEWHKWDRKPWVKKS
jgi:hypothetical protein